MYNEQMPSIRKTIKKKGSKRKHRQSRKKAGGLFSRLFGSNTVPPAPAPAPAPIPIPIRSRCCKCPPSQPPVQHPPVQQPPVIPYCSSLQKMRGMVPQGASSECGWMNDTLVSTAIGSMLSNGGKHLLVPVSLRAKMTNAQGRLDCDCIVKQMQKLNEKMATYRSCSTLTNLRLIALYGFQFEREHLMLLPILFDMFPRVMEIHFGLNPQVTLSPEELRQIESDFGDKYTLRTQETYLAATRR